MTAPKLVSYIEGYNGYEWDVFGVFAAEDGSLLWATDGGCSCYYAWEDLSVIDFQPGTFADIDAACAEWTRDSRAENAAELPDKRVKLMQAVARFMDTGEVADGLP